MHQGNGYVVVSARPKKFKAQVKTIIVSKSIIVTFGNKTIYFDPREGKSDSSRTLRGALEILASRVDIEDLDSIVGEFKEKGKILIAQMENDGYLVPHFKSPEVL